MTLTTSSQGLEEWRDYYRKQDEARARARDERRAATTARVLARVGQAGAPPARQQPLISQIQMLDLL